MKPGPAQDFVRSGINLDEVAVRGLHHVQHDSPDEMGEAIVMWRQE